MATHFCTMSLVTNTQWPFPNTNTNTSITKPIKDTLEAIRWILTARGIKTTFHPTNRLHRLPVHHRREGLPPLCTILTAQDTYFIFISFNIHAGNQLGNLSFHFLQLLLDAGDLPWHINETLQEDEDLALVPKSLHGAALGVGKGSPNTQPTRTARTQSEIEIIRMYV